MGTSVPVETGTSTRVTNEVDPPLRIDWIGSDILDDGHAGRLGLTFLPGKHGPSLRYPGTVYRRDLEADLETLREAGILRLLLLVEDGELDRWGDADIVRRAARRGIAVDRRPIPDGAPPRTMDEMDEILGSLADARSGGNVAVACMGGVGRTGTVVACALVAAGLEADAAINEVRKIRHPTAVETDAQVEFVRGYARRLAARG